MTTLYQKDQDGNMKVWSISVIKKDDYFRMPEFLFIKEYKKNMRFFRLQISSIQRVNSRIKLYISFTLVKLLL